MDFNDLRTKAQLAGPLPLLFKHRLCTCWSLAVPKPPKRCWIHSMDQGAPEQPLEISLPAPPWSHPAPRQVPMVLPYPLFALCLLPSTSLLQMLQLIKGLIPFDPAGKEMDEVGSSSIPGSCHSGLVAQQSPSPCPIEANFSILDCFLIVSATLPCCSC